ncbi:MAG: prepilin-type N-terminal cleavage/methylation domain-containing protein [Candidatus Portnoybacteria bacterium]|nr:prepilin-type N-terminal cleavage/methylation domain-containing protein [Candidatus Portnoybacteria bacterium]
MQTYRGFSLIEILFVIAIIGILAAIVLVNIGEKPLVSSRDSRRLADVSHIQTALRFYYASDAAGRFSYPASLGDLVSSYLPALPADPSGGASGCQVSYGGDTVYKYRYIALSGSGGTCSTAALDCTQYVLQTCLEEPNHSALAADCDSNALIPPCSLDPVYDIHS